MDTYTTILWRLAAELFNAQEQSQLRGLAAAQVPNLEAVTAYDHSLGGPSMSRLTHNHTERYALEDRAVFRSLQYCAMDMTRVNGTDWENDAKSFSRDLMENSSKHINALLDNIGGTYYLPFGKALRNAAIKRKVDSRTWGQINALLDISNDAKRQFGRNKVTAAFSVEDALLVYFICRKLGMRLYPLAKLSTNMQLFETDDLLHK
jgi:hypothetical protein